MAQLAAIIGSGNVGSDLMMKLLSGAGQLGLAAVIDNDSDSGGLIRARRLGVATISTGVDGLIASPVLDQVDIVFDATSAQAHPSNASKLAAARPGIGIVNLTPTAIGQLCIPAVSLEEHAAAGDLGMVSCSAQAGVPVIAAISGTTEVFYAEIAATISSFAAGPAVRDDIDELVETTARAIKEIGGARHAKAIFQIDPVTPPVPMRVTVSTLSAGADPEEVVRAVSGVVAAIADHLPGYRLLEAIHLDKVEAPLNVPGLGAFVGLRTTVVLEVAGAGDYLPAYAGNLDVLTCAALRAGRRMAAQREQSDGATT